MKRFHKQLAAAFIGTMGFIALLGIVGSYDYASEVVQSMPEAAYYRILDTLGDDCSEKAIAAEYMSNREYYDNLQY